MRQTCLRGPVTRFQALPIRSSYSLVATGMSEVLFDDLLRSAVS